MADEKDKPGTARRKSAWIPSRPDPRGAPPAMLADVLCGTEEIFAKRAGSAIPRAEWVSIVGTRVAARTRVGRLQRGILTIKVASSAWTNELSFLKGDFINKLRRAGHEVREIRFRVDPTADDAEDKRRGVRRVPLRAPGAEAPLPPDLVERLKKVEDPNLRAAIFEAARASLNKT